MSGFIPSPTLRSFMGHNDQVYGYLAICVSYTIVQRQSEHKFVHFV